MVKLCQDFGFGEAMVVHTVLDGRFEQVEELQILRDLILKA